MPIPVASALRALVLRRDPDAVIIHAEQSWYDTILSGKFDFYQKLERRLHREGHPLYIARMASRASRYLRHGRGVQIMVSDRPKPGPRRLHAMPTHIWGFWHFDPKGILQFSTIPDKTFDPDTVDADMARYFFDGVTGYMLGEGVTRHNHTPRSATPLAPARAAVFVQHIDLFKRHPAYVETLPMLRETLAACAPDPVYVKLHPQQRAQTIADIRAVLAQHPNARETDAHVHDVIAAAQVVVTQNSTAGFEALMQRKPVVTCAPCAFHHATLVARSADQVAPAVRAAPDHMAGFPFDKYFYWFLGENCLEPAKPNFEDRAWHILQTECGL